MLRTTTKMLSLLVVLVMVFALAACQTTTTPAATSGAEATKAPAATSDDKETADAEEPVTSELPFVSITHYALGDPPTTPAMDLVQAEWNKLLKGRLNCELNQMWVNWTDYMTKYNLLLASGDQTIDLVETSSTWLELWQNADRGAWLPLDDLIPEYAPVTWAEVPPETWDECRFRGEIVCFPENDYTQYVNHGIMYRGDWAEAAGLPLQLTTIEEFEQYCDWIKENKPGVYPIDAGGGVDQSASFWGYWIKINSPHISILGVSELVYGDSLKDPYTAVTPAFEGDLFLKYVTDMRRWDDKGFWREDVLNNTASMDESFKAGTSGVRLHHVQTFRGLKYEMDEKLFPGESNLQMMIWSDVDGGELIQDPISTHGGMAVSANSQNPERAVMVYEFIRNDEEMYRLFNWGIQGTQWDIDDEGFKIQPTTYDKSQHEFFSNFWGGRVDKFELPSRTEWAGIYDLWARLDKDVVPNPYAQFVFDKMPIDAELTTLSSIVTEYRPLLNFGKAGDPEAAVAEYRNKLTAAGIEAYKAEVQKQLTEYKAYKGD